MSNSPPSILLIGSDNPTTWMVYNELIKHFGLFDALIEQPVPRKNLIINRMRKLGWLTAFSQVLFATLIRPLLLKQSRARISAIQKSHGLEATRPMTGAIRFTENINAPEALVLMKQFNPRVVVVNGTRILKPATLDNIAATFINTHQGITPQYRGAHGAYWALFQNDLQNCGVTIHLVDQGIDTGNIVAQAIISPGPDDNFTTYPYLQTVASLPLLTAAIEASLTETLKSWSIEGPSAVWYHPGFLQYLKGRWRGIR